MQIEWFKSWFGKDYLRLYAHRDQREASRQIEFVLDVVSSIPRLAIDIGCGSGRHVYEMLKRNVAVIGIDLSQELLQQAAQKLSRVSSNSLLIRADMRWLPIAASSADLLLNMFTAFGYFEDDAEHLKLLTDWRSLLTPNGWLCLDYLNYDYTVRSIGNSSISLVTPKGIEQTRYISNDGKRVIKDIKIQEPCGKTRQYVESVRLYRPDEVLELMTHAGYRVQKIYGSFSGKALNATSERLIVFAQNYR